MEKKIELTIKFNTNDQLADTLESIAISARNGALGPNDIGEYSDGIGYSYDVSDNDGTDIYGKRTGGERC